MSHDWDRAWVNGGQTRSDDDDGDDDDGYLGPDLYRDDGFCLHGMEVILARRLSYCHRFHSQYPVGIRSNRMQRISRAAGYLTSVEMMGKE